jgi:hypothetical protein
MRWAGHVARTGERRGVYRVLVGKLKGNLEDPGLDERIIFRCIFRMWDGLDLSGLGWRQVAGTCECGYKPSGSIKCGEFLN